MNLLQLIIIPIILFLLLIYQRNLKNQILTRLIFTLIFLGGIVITLYPKLLDAISQFLGISRGIDLLLYFITILFYFSFIKIYSKLRSQEKTITKIIREVAINEAKKMD